MTRGDRPVPLSANEQPWRERAVVVAVVALPLLVMFGPALMTDRSFAMRDAGHYYYPLFKWCADEWRAGRVPLVCPLEGGGTPLCADPTASLWYPGKLVFALPLGSAVNYKLYVVGHVVLCAIAAYWLARRWGGSRYAASLAALSYACGGSVAFQHANVVYLVGAAWLPVAAGLIDDIFRERRLSSAVWLGVVLALMVLGGDAQMAYHVLLLGGLCAANLGCSRGTLEPADANALRQQFMAVLRGLSHLLIAAIVALLLAAVQILPSDEAIRTSDRKEFTNPRNVFEMVRGSETHNLSGDQVARGLLGAPQPGTHHQALYDFSVAPWRLAELIWPNVGGRMFPTHRRWFSLLPEDSRIWTPTIYMGLLPLVVGLSVFRLRGDDLRTGWLSWSVLLFVLGSFGTFGLGWVLRHVLGWESGPNAPIGDGVGGVYWLFVVFLPKYVLFRYPAKLLVVAALGISQLAAMGWDRAQAETPQRTIWSLAAFGVTSLTASLAAALAAQFTVLGAGSADPVFGPFDNRGAWTDVVYALVHTGVVSLATAWLLARAAHWAAPLALLAVCAAELTLANCWIVPTAPSEHWRQSSPVAAVLSGDRRRSHLFRARLPWPREFATTSSPRRIEELIAWEHATLAGRYGLLDDVAIVNSQLAVVSNDRRQLLEQLEGSLNSPQSRDALAHLAVGYVLVPRDDGPAASEVAPLPGLPASIELRRLPTQAVPRVEPSLHQPEISAFYWGAWLSGISWTALLAACTALWIKRRKRASPA